MTLRPFAFLAIFFALLALVTLRPFRAKAADRSHALSALHEAEDNRRVEDPALVSAEHAASSRLRARAALALGRIQDPRGIDPLLALVADWDPEVCRTAAFSLGQLGWKAEFTQGREAEIVAALRPFLMDPSPKLRLTVVEALGKLGLEKTPELVLPLLKDPSELVRAEALLAIARYRLVLTIRQPDATAAPLGGEALNAVLLAAHDPKPGVRRAAAYALLRLKDARSFDTQLILAQDKDLWTRLFTINGIGHNPGSQNAAAAAPVVIAAAADKSFEVRTAAVESAVLLKAVDRLPEALVRDSAFHVRAAYAGALGDVLVADAAADPALKTLMQDASATVRSAALTAYISRHPAEAIAVLTPFTFDPNWVLRSAAVDASVPMESAAREQFLQPALADTDVRVRAEAIQAIGGIDSPGAYAAIRHALESDQLAERGSAIDALSTRKEPDAVAEAWNCYQRSTGWKWVELREGLIDILAKTRTDETTAELRVALTDPAGSVSAKAFRALRDRGVADISAPAAPTLSYSPYRDLTFLKNPFLQLKTTRGTIRIELFARAAPIHVATIVGFAEAGGYDGLLWHRVVSNFVVQGGDPDGTGWGSAGYALRAEINPVRFDRGMLGMPRSDGFDTGGVQLFITHVPTPNLDGQYTVFGRVIQGMDAVDRLEVGDRILSAKVFR